MACGAARGEDGPSSGVGSCPGHEHWSRDFKGSSSIFSIVFADQFDMEQVNGFVDALRLSKIGFSWGG
jgi:cystathionine beta-lyase